MLKCATEGFPLGIPPYPSLLSAPILAIVDADRLYELIDVWESG